MDLTDGRYSEVELDDQYNIVVLEDGVPKPVISGGEEDLAYLVLRLAISQMIAERAGQSFSLLILDEVFGSLDESRRHNVVDLLRRLHDRFEQVILISHIDTVREGLDRVITVRYDEDRGCSVVEQADQTVSLAGVEGAGAVLGAEDAGPIGRAARAATRARPSRARSGDGGCAELETVASRPRPLSGAARGHPGAQPGLQRVLHRAVPSRRDGWRACSLSQPGDLAVRARRCGDRRHGVARRAG